MTYNAQFTPGETKIAENIEKLFELNDIRNEIKQKISKKDRLLKLEL